ncbi:uncharacterized protein CDAR_553911 [Caerostris darwini]|uniref:Uncharacterized protein n=1 Tax=Caerostris darwini TaxID=1538125 RepID=A0AAV4X7G6_9ARAC|nr:uncharacterized protein CDAR_553911 [Caerostris darwini]
MKIGLLLFLTTFWLSIDASVTYSVEDIMRSVLKKIMTCPNTPDAYASRRPVAAFSPARFMQLVALVRKDSGATRKTKIRNAHASETSKELNAVSFKENVGSIIAFSLDANLNFRVFTASATLLCKIYFYDHGIENTYLPFPEDFVMIDVVEAPVIQETESGSYEIIGGNSHKSLTTSISHRKRKNIPYDQEFTFNIQKRNENFLRHNPFLRYPVKKSMLPKDENYGNRYLHSKRRSLRNYKSKKIKEFNPNDFYGNNFKQNSEIRPDSYDAYAFKSNFRNQFQRNWNESPNYKRIRNENSGYDFHKESFPFSERNEGFFNENRKSVGSSKSFRSLDFEDGAFEEDRPDGENGPVFSQSELTDDWERSNQYMDENILPKSNTNSRALIKPMEEFYEKQPRRAIRSELSTVRVLWSDSEIEDGKIIVIIRIISLIIPILKKIVKEM